MPVSPLDVAGRTPTRAELVVELDRIEAQLSTDLRLPVAQLRVSLPKLLHACAVDETTIVQQWLAAISAVEDFE